VVPPIPIVLVIRILIIPSPPVVSKCVTEAVLPTEQPTHTHTLTHTHTHARTRTRTHAHTHAHHKNNITDNHRRAHTHTNTKIHKHTTHIRFERGVSQHRLTPTSDHPCSEPTSAKDCHLCSRKLRVNPRTQVKHTHTHTHTHTHIDTNHKNKTTGQG